MNIQGILAGGMIFAVATAFGAVEKVGLGESGAWYSWPAGKLRIIAGEAKDGDWLDIPVLI